MAKTKGGWYRESQRHRQAKLYGKATPKTIDLKKYSGKWEQTKVINEPSFQKGCEKVTATYTPMKEGRIKVTNRCYKKGRKVEKIVGTARSVSKNNKQLKVSFFPLIEGDYKILKVNKNYTRARVKGGKTIWELKKVNNHG